MAFSKIMAATFLILLLSSLLVESHSQQEHQGGSSSPLSPEECASKCQVRCSKSWKPKMCHRTCNTCCTRCNCVPSGTGPETKSECPCYANMKTRGGRYKCP